MDNRLAFLERYAEYVEGEDLQDDCILRHVSSHSLNNIRCDGLDSIDFRDWKKPSHQSFNLAFGREKTY